jgi:carboxyl-terminal processing protease
MRLMKLSFAIIISVFLSFSAYAAKPSSTAAADQDALPVQDVEKFVTAFSIIKHYYVKSEKDSTLFNNAIEGLVSKLDPHSEYLDEKEVHELTVATSGKFSGIGVEIVPQSGGLKVISPIDDSPAQVAGIKSGDIIMKVNDHLIQDLSMQDAMKLIRGKQGSEVTLVVLRKDESKPLVFNVKREEIKVKNVKYKILNPGYGYIRIAVFNGPLKEELHAAIKNLKAQSTVPLKGIVLDLRNNPGGLLNSAIDVTNVFLRPSDVAHHNGLVVYTKGRAEGSSMKFKADPLSMAKNIPVVVLINGGSASASEIVAGALQDYKRALVMGTRSFGKGSVQTVIPMGSDTAIKLTTSLYYTPAGRSIQAEGIMPDVVIPAFTLKDSDKSAEHFSVKESELDSHIENQQAHKNPQSMAELLIAENQVLAQEDYQLYQALMMLYAMHTIHKPFIAMRAK